MPRPEVVPYSALWQNQFAAVASQLSGAFGAGALRIDHIGSTSVSGLDAKDCIDVQVTVADVASELDPATRDHLVATGFEEYPYGFDHVPAGSGDDQARWTKRFWMRRSVAPSVNLHIRAAGSPNQRFALLFRDYLRARPAAAAAYGAAKHALAEVCDDVDIYADVKDPIVDIVMVAAEEWASATGWSVESLPVS